MKRIYEKPMAIEEAFIANEYVAACYYLACRRGSYGTNGIENHWHSNEKWPWNGTKVTHSKLGTSGTCADKTANRVITDDGNVFQTVEENNTAQGGWIPGGFDYWIDSNDSKKMDAGDMIYWHTNSKNGDRQWNHYGTLELADKSHPNHS